MRSIVLRTTSLGFFAAAIALSTPSRAQDFAGAKWIPLVQSGVAVGDPVGDSTGGANDARDIVGDAANPAAYVYEDAGYLYFRLRVNGNPLQNDGAFIPFGWACAIEADGTLNTYEFLSAVDGNTPNGPGGENDEVEWWWNQTTTNLDKVTEQADVLVAAFQRSTHTRVTVAPSMFSGNADYFIDWAVPLATIRAGGGGAPGIPAGSTLRFACGTSNNAKSYGADPACALANNQCTLTSSWSDALLCDASACGYDHDGDGVFDTIENALGTNPDAKDSDGDGIPDNVELSASGGAGPFGPIDTDGDGVIDALDKDSDNDCAPDAVEGTAAYRTRSATPDANCSGATPICDLASGACTASCATDADCPGAGRICDTGLCRDGCRGGAAPKACATGSTCSSADAVAGKCTPIPAKPDSDGDGVSDELEASLGTNPHSKDTDGDGIPDNVELSASGGAGPFAAIDTDGDGVIDAKDLDSDNDCLPDSAEPETYRVATAPHAQADANCPSGQTCDTTKGACVAVASKPDRDSGAPDGGAPDELGAGAGSLEGGGCSITTRSGTGTAGGAFLLGLVLTRLVRRRRPVHGTRRAR